MEKQLGTISTEKHKIDSKTLREYFFYHILAGFIFIILLRLFNANVMTAIIFGVIIMCSYFYSFKKGGEPHALIDTFSDSIYYLGFLLTLVSLIIAMIFFDIDDGALSASYILTQFGAAMTTTLLGMSFRIWYKQFDTTVGSAQISARESLDQTVRDFNIQMRSTHKTLSRLTETLDKNIKDTELRNEKSLELYNYTQHKIVEMSEESFNSFSAAVQKNINDSISKLNEFIGATSRSMDKIVSDNLSANSLIINSSSKLLKKELEQLFDQIKSDFVDTFKAVYSSTDKLNIAFDGASNSINSLEGTISKTVKISAKQLEQFKVLEPNFKAIEASQTEFMLGLDKLTLSIKDKVKTISTVDVEIGNNIAKIVNDYKSMFTDFKNFSTGIDMKKISEEEKGLIEAFQNRRKSLEQLSTQWSADAEDMSRNSRLFSENLIKTSQFIARELNSVEPKMIEKVS